MSWYCYKITNLVTGKIYVGKAKSIKVRWAAHKTAAIRKDPNDYTYIHKSMNKHGFDNFKIEQVAEFETEREALDAETFYIKEWKCRDKSIGYNLTDGGDGASGYKFTDKQRQNLSNAKKGKLLGEENPFFGKEHSAESKALMSHGQIEYYQNNKDKVDAINVEQCNFNKEECLLIQKDYLSHLSFEGLTKKYNTNLHTIHHIIHGIYMSIRGYSIITDEEIERIKSERCKATGLKIRRFTDPSELNQLIEDLKSGMKGSELAKKHNSNRITIAKVLKENGFSLVPQIKLTAEKVLEIRDFYAKNLLNIDELAIKYEVSRSTIEAVIKRKTWKHI